MNEQILIIEDETAIQSILSELLTDAGYNIEIASDGLEGIRKFREQHFSLILLDIMMPKIDGYTATRVIRSTNRQDAKAIPIIAMTANAFSEDIQHSLAAGMNAHISKPVDMKTLEKTVRSIKSGGGCTETQVIEA